MLKITLLLVKMYFLVWKRVWVIFGARWPKKIPLPTLFNGPKVFSSASDQEKLFSENFSKNSNLEDSGIFLPVFPSRTNLKLHNISVTPKMVKKVVMNLDLSKTSDPDCTPVVILKNCEPEFCYTLAEFFNKCLKESYQHFRKQRWPHRRVARSCLKLWTNPKISH